MKRLLLLAVLFLNSTARAEDIDTMIGAPFEINNGGGAVSFNNFVINSNDDKIAVCFQSETNDTITHLGFRYGLRAVTPVAHKIDLQAGSLTGIGPDGTVLGGGTPAEGAFTPPADTTWNATWRKIDITDYTPTRGQFMCIVVEPTGTPDGTNNSSFTTHMVNTRTRRAFPYSVTKTNGGAWTAQSSEPLPIFGYYTASRAYGIPIKAVNAGATFFSSDSTPDERCLRAKIPSTWTGTYYIPGFEMTVDTIPASGKTVNFNMYIGTNTSADQTVALDTDLWFGNTGSDRTAEVWFSDTNLDAITAGSVVRLCVAPGSTGTNFGLGYFDVDTNTEMSAFGGGLEWYYSTRTDGGAWDSDTTTRRPLIVPWVRNLTAAASGGLKTLNSVAGGAQ